MLFTCNNWGELRLRKNMFPHEYSFLIKYTDTVIEMNDCHLAGEFLEVFIYLLLLLFSIIIIIYFNSVYIVLV